MAHDCPADGTPAFGCSACYGHLKRGALNGDRDKLSPDELEFVGVRSDPAEPARSDGWHQPNTIPAHLSPDAALLRALMDMDATPGQERMRFLGG